MRRVSSTCHGVQPDTADRAARLSGHRPQSRMQSLVRSRRHTCSYVSETTRVQFASVDAVRRRYSSMEGVAEHGSATALPSNCASGMIARKGGVEQVAENAPMPEGWQVQSPVPLENNGEEDLSVVQASCATEVGSSTAVARAASFIYYEDLAGWWE